MSRSGRPCAEVRIPAPKKRVQRYNQPCRLCLPCWGEIAPKGFSASSFTPRELSLGWRPKGVCPELKPDLKDSVSHRIAPLPPLSGLFAMGPPETGRSLPLLEGCVEGPETELPRQIPALASPLEGPSTTRKRIGRAGITRAASFPKRPFLARQVASLLLLLFLVRRLLNSPSPSSRRVILPEN